MLRIQCLLLTAGLALSAGTAGAIDLTTAGATATVQSVIFTQGDPYAPSTSLVQPFLRIQATSTEQGFNTDFRPLEPDAVGTITMTHSMQFGSLARRLVTSASGSDYYYELRLDVNEGSISGESYLSLDQLRAYSAAVPNIATLADLASSATLHYDLDLPSDQQLLLDAALEPGTGIVDLTIQIPTWYFAGVPDASYLYLFFRAGGAGLVGGRNYGSSGGFEEMLALVPGGTSGVDAGASVPPAPWIHIAGGPSLEGARFRCSVPGSGRATIGLYDVRGRRVGSVFHDTSGPAVFEVPLVAFGRARRPASGIYFYRFEWNGDTRTVGKVTLLR